MLKKLFAVLAIALLGANTSGGIVTETRGSSPIVDNASYSAAPNIVKVKIRHRGCNSTKCEITVQSHNARLDVGAQFVATQMGNAAGASANVAQFIALSSDTATVVKTDTTCTSELATNGMNRKIATFSYTTPPSTLGGSATYTLSNSYNATGAYTINKLCLFTLISGGTMLFETLLGSTVAGGNGDTVNVVWTVNV